MYADRSSNAGVADLPPSLRGPLFLFRFGEAVDGKAESHDTGGESTPDNTEFPHFRSAFPVHLRRLRNGPEGGKFLRPIPNFPPPTQY